MHKLITAITLLAHLRCYLTAGLRFYCSIGMLGFMLSAPVAAQNSFVIQDIRVEGLGRITAGTVFTYLPVSIGSTVSSAQYPEIIRSLFKTGFFTDVSLERDGNVLVLRVTERPAIAEITLEGNKDLSDDDLKESLRTIGLAEGQVFNRSLLSNIEQELIEQYFARGKYAVEIKSNVRPLERNRVAINIDISEGVAARIQRVNIVGNKAFTDKKLLKEFKSRTSGLLTIITKADQYSREQLTADIEVLRSFYLDRGYLKFNVDSTQVTITPDKKDIYITINITEGEPYTVSDVLMAGELVIPEEQLRPLILTQSGETFSRRLVTEDSTDLRDRLGNQGYAFATVEAVPTIDEQNKQVMLTYVIDPGRRVYVRRINFTGNVKTHDEVLRREMRQAEGGQFSRQDIERSKVRLERLGYINEAEIETVPVPGSVDQIDVNYKVSEIASGSVIVGLGYGQTEGVLLNATYRQRNFLGSGNEVTLAFNNSQADTVYSFGYNNPYFTPDGVSRGFRVTYQETDVAENNGADYVLDEFIATINFGFPLNETDTIRIGGGIDDTKIKPTTNTPPEILADLEQNGDKYLNFKIDGSWARDSRNRAIFADSGMLNRISWEFTLPSSDAEFYKIDYRHQSLWGWSDSLVLVLRGTLGYGDSYDDRIGLPFFENYYAGGLRTVRGFKTNTLGPKYSSGDPAGGSFRLTGGVEAVAPLPLLEDSKNLRMSGFVDIGNVYATFDDFDAGTLRYSVGLSVMWISPLGPLAVSYAQPLNDEEGDQIENIQFSLGLPF